MTPKKWVIYVVSLIILLFLFTIGDALLAGTISLCALLFEAEVAKSIFKWVFVVLLYLETLVTIPYLYRIVKNRKDL